MKHGFYPYSGPAGRDDPSRPYPRWYYPDADGAVFTVHNLQEFFTAVDYFYRRVFGNSTDPANFLWFRGLSCDRFSLLPRLLRDGGYDERAAIADFTASRAFEQALSYPDLIFRMYLCGAPTRLLEWTQNAVEALIFALASGGSVEYAALVWVLSPLWLNRPVCGDGMPPFIFDALDPWTAPLFGDPEAPVEGMRPFAAFADDGAGMRRLFTVFPPAPGFIPLERLPDSAAFLFRILIPPLARPILWEQLRRAGLI